MEDDSATRDFSDGSPSEEEGSSYVLSTEVEEDVSSSWSDVEASDSTDDTSPRVKKRRRLDPQPPPPRPDNVQTRKLRPPQHLRQRKEPTPVPTTDSSPSSPEPELIREVSEEEAQRGLTTRFQNDLSLTPVLLKMSDVEQAIINCNGRGLLAQLHIGLMKGLKPRLGMDETNWPAVLARKFRSEIDEPMENPFKPERGNEALEYCTAPVAQRVLILKLLCDIRCAENDIREVFDLSLKPKAKATQKQRKKQRAAAGVNLLRKAPIGQLNALTVFWFLESSEIVDFRLYKETREHTKKNGKIRGNTKVKSWELIATDLGSLCQFAEDLPTAGTYSRNLRKKILDDVVPRLEKQMEREERKQRAAEKLRQHECNIILDQNGGYGRSARHRTEAKYTFEEYERAMAEAIDEGRLRNDQEFLSPVSSVMSLPDAMSTVEEASMDGMEFSVSGESDSDKRH